LAATTSRKRVTGIEASGDRRETRNESQLVYGIGSAPRSSDADGGQTSGQEAG